MIISDLIGRDMRSFELVIFDNDGVLVDSEPHAITVLTELLTELGLSSSYDENFERFVGSSVGRVRRLAEAEMGRQLPRDFEDRYYAELFDRFRRELQPITGVKTALKQIDAPKCVASSGPHTRIRLALEATGLWGEFEGNVFSRDDVERGKPAPDLFLLAAKSMRARPDRSAVVEDSPLGIEAANAAGMTSFGFAASTPKERLRAATGDIFTKMQDLPRILKRF
jgi:HAD superfamily hydrolase (TIGR01509 family)